MSDLPNLLAYAIGASTGACVGIVLLIVAHTRIWLAWHTSISFFCIVWHYCRGRASLEELVTRLNDTRLLLGKEPIDFEIHSGRDHEGN